MQQSVSLIAVMLEEYATDGEPARAGGPTVASLLGRVGELAAWSSPRIRAAAADVTGPAEQLIAIQREQNRQELTRIASLPQASPCVSLAAWRRLGEAKGAWPSTVADLDTELALSGRLLGALPPSRPDLTATVTLGRRARWDRYLARNWTANGPVALEWFGRQVAAGTIGADDLPPWFVFNLHLAHFKANPNDVEAFIRFARDR